MEAIYCEIAAIRKLTFHKGCERYIIRYEAGQEDRVIDEFFEMARDDRLNLDISDVDTLAYIVRKIMEEGFG